VGSDQWGKEKAEMRVSEIGAAISRAKAILEKMTAETWERDRKAVLRMLKALPVK
jgi:hypothetical protein